MRFQRKKWADETRRRKIYFILAKGIRHLKIGYTEQEPEQRMRAMQSGNSIELTLLGWVKGSSKEERLVLKHFEHLRIRREWFHYTYELQEFVQGVVSGEVSFRDFVKSISE